MICTYLMADATVCVSVCGRMYGLIRPVVSLTTACLAWFLPFLSSFLLSITRCSWIDRLIWSLIFLCFFDKVLCPVWLFWKLNPEFSNKSECLNFIRIAYSHLPRIVVRNSARKQEVFWQNESWGASCPFVICNIWIRVSWFWWSNNLYSRIP